MYMHTCMHMLSYIAYCRVNSVGVFGTGSSSSSHSGYSYYRKERALKIYTDDDSPRDKED